MILLNGKRIDSTVGDALPIGTLSPFVGLVAPKGYLICMGQLVDKAKYPELWELCGDTFGPSTTTQFYLPDLRGQVIAGYKEGDATFGTLGALIGGKTTSYTPAGINTGGAVGNHTLTTSEMPSHSHGISRMANSSKAEKGGCWTGDSQFHIAASRNLDATTFPSVISNDNLEIKIGNAGSGGAHNHGFTQPTFTGTQANISTIQPTAVFNWIIKASMLAVVTGNIEDSLTSTSGTDALSARQGKVLNDKFDNYVLTSSIVNSLTSTSTTVPLSAAQGKALNDKIANLKRVELFSGSWVRGETKTIDTSSYVKLEILMSLNPSDSAYSTIYTISYDNAGNRTGLISGITKCMNGYFYQVEIQKQANNKILFDYGAYAHQESIGTWTQDTTSKGVITKVYGYKEI